MSLRVCLGFLEFSLGVELFQRTLEVIVTSFFVLLQFFLSAEVGFPRSIWPDLILTRIEE